MSDIAKRIVKKVFSGTGRTVPPIYNTATKVTRTFHNWLADIIEEDKKELRQQLTQREEELSKVKQKLKVTERERDEAYFDGMKDAKTALFRFGAEIGDSKERIAGVTHCENVIGSMINTGSRDKAKGYVKPYQFQPTKENSEASASDNVVDGEDK